MTERFTVLDEDIATAKNERLMAEHDYFGMMQRLGSAESEAMKTYSARDKMRWPKPWDKAVTVEEAQAIHDKACRLFGVEPVPVIRRDARREYAETFEDHITISGKVPANVILHETAHFLLNMAAVRLGLPYYKAVLYGHGGDFNAIYGYLIGLFVGQFYERLWERELLYENAPLDKKSRLLAELNDMRDLAAFGVTREDRHDSDRRLALAA